ncbi:DUF1624 domain-containing protein [Desulfovibrio aerotolerans]|uniref:DUF1624 domain-containing protein n=1 Tax=Solidesulfovibrio aerotolerans TaxID=295255 RepID=A0A7C9MPA8_9BACT|nr:heparan-alpha-glucosaminide N-acetyltransferase domain-containing protein [Solidesulfovibrio aerotolerans]MYL83532.1 DUF1624 domain-containing protein [Solidesulfovibrio aerotolerans]
MSTERKARLTCVDCLRGLAVAVMIVVNNPGDSQHVFPQLRHAAWNGLTLADCVFPLFLVLVGTSVGLSIDRDRVRAGQAAGFWPKVGRRTGILFALGLLENAYWRFSFESLRLPGVLQRIAIVYLVAAWLHVRLCSRALAALILTLLTGYWLLLGWVPVPGLGRPSLDADSNLQGWLDQLLLGSHIWKFGTTWDPEGVLSTLPAIALGLIGVLAGRWLRRGAPAPGRAAGLGLAVLGLGRLWSLWFPLNKSICSSSFVLVLGGAGVVLLAATHWLLNGRGRAVWPAWAAWARPLTMLGTNALAVYATASFLAASLRHIHLPGGPNGSMRLQAYLYQGLFAGQAPSDWASLGWSLLCLLVMLLGAWALSARRIVITL